MKKRVYTRLGYLSEIIANTDDDEQKANALADFAVYLAIIDDIKVEDTDSQAARVELGKTEASA